MMKMSSILAAALVLAAPVAAGATTLLDGSFEIEGAALPVTNYCYDGFATPGGPACAPGAWVGGGVILSGSGAWGGTTTPSGGYFGFVQSTSVVSQSFTATESGTGVVSWIDTNRANIGGLQSYDVTIFDGVGSVNIGTYTSAIGSFVARNSSTFTLTNGTTYTLRFTGLSSQDRTAFIDNVVLAATPSAIPEPATWMILVAGFGLVGFAARRRTAISVAA